MLRVIGRQIHCRAFHRGALSLLGYKCGFGQSRVCQSVVISPLESAFTSSILSP
ncbi:hypothetical protein RchiOBHm_Chr1g0356631 [Rosa chinensis]|uniref:Uncharacterized protein n=1 Tax=Rosa chinensis TaxID=74649 RepID=A0A2P6SHS8_ROSCH|nr:hypothetical protein RchiOBHm_Chr1g0356631 [Rosa chinensis]